MIILRVFLYLVCIFSIGWSIIVFGGPLVIKKIITGYTSGALIPSDISVSPTLDIRISRLDYNFQIENFEKAVEGFSRATEISWSFFDEKPFIDINFGPTVLKNFASADDININIPSYRKVDWQNIFLNVNAGGLTVNSYGKTETVNLNGNLNLRSSTLSNLKFEANTIFAKVDGSTYSSESAKGELSDLSLDISLSDQIFSSIFSVKNIMFAKPNIGASEANVEFAMQKGVKNLKIGLPEVKLSEFGSLFKNVKVDGIYDSRNTLQDLSINLVDGTFSRKSPNFSNISARLFKTGNQRYEANIEGNLDKFEMFNSGNFLGLLPPSKFLIDLELEESIARVTSSSKVTFSEPEMADFDGVAELIVRAESLHSVKCLLLDCDLPSFDLSYRVDVNEEWIEGTVKCPQVSCGPADIGYFLTTSDTVNLFTIFNQAGILTPLSSIYLFGIVSSGKKINSGHELQF